MNNTWASGALELLKHSDSHIHSKTAFDNRIAFISIDNAVEVLIRVFLSMPERVSGVSFSRRERDEVGSSFPKMLELLFQKASDKLVSLSEHDIEYYHRIRNQIYHDGTGLAVDVEQLQAYRQVAEILLNNLFGIRIEPKTREMTIAYFILLCDEVETIVKTKFIKGKIDTGHTFKWEMAVKEGVLNYQQIKVLTDLRMIRNYEVHADSSKLSNTRLSQGIELAELLLSELKS